MLIKRGDKQGYLWDTVKGKYVKDPNFSLRRIQEIENSDSKYSGLDLEELLGVSNQRNMTVDVNIKYLMTEEEWNLATPESTSIMDKAYNSIRESLHRGVIPKASFFFSISHKARVVDLASTFLLNAHVGGLSIHKIQYLSNLDKFNIDQFNKDILVVIAPHNPSDRELSVLITMLEYRDQLAKPTIIITSKYSVHPYRLILTTENSQRLDLAYLIALQQERSLDKLENMAKGLDFSFKKVKNKFRTLGEQPDNDKAKSEYEAELRSTFVDISQQKSVNVSRSLFDIE